MGREYKWELDEIYDTVLEARKDRRVEDGHYLQVQVALAIAERLEALVEVMEEKLTQIAQNLAK